MRKRERSQDPHIHAYELDCEADATGEHQVASEHDAVRHTAAAPPNQQPRNDEQREHFIELRRMHARVGWREAARERHAPRQIRGTSIVVADEKTADSSDGVADRECGRRGRERRDDG